MYRKDPRKIKAISYDEFENLMYNKNIKEIQIVRDMQVNIDFCKNVIVVENDNKQYFLKVANLNDFLKNLERYNLHHLVPVNYKYYPHDNTFIDSFFISIIAVSFYTLLVTKNSKITEIANSFLSSR